MPFTNGVFANVSGASNAAAGDIIQSAVWNAIHSDYSTALNMLMGQMINMPSNRNIAWMNGGFEVWQRGNNGAVGAPFLGVGSSNTAYTVDRWFLTAGANQGNSIVGLTGLTDKSLLCARVQRNSGETGTTAMIFAYPLDTDEILRCRGSLINISFRVRAGANWSPASGALSYAVFTGTGASPAKRGVTPYTGETAVISGTLSLTSSIVLVQTSSAVIVPVNATQAEIHFTWTPVGTAGTDDYFELDDLQLEVSVSPNTYTITAYDRLPFNVMLEGCKGHFQKSQPFNNAPLPGTTTDDAYIITPQVAAEFRFFTILPVELRATAGITLQSPVTATSSAWFNSTNTSTSIAVTGVGGVNKRISITGVAATAGSTLSIHAVVSAGI